MRARLTALASVAVLLVLAATGAGLVAGQRATLTEDLEDSLVASASTLAASPADGPVLAGFGDGDAIAQILDVDGRVIAATANLAGRPAVAPAGDGFVMLDDLPHDDGAFRVLRRAVDRGGGGTVIVGTGLDDIEDSTRALVGALAAAVPATALVLAVVVWWLVGRALRPVEAIRAEVAAIGGGEPGRRVPEPGTGDEIDDLARTMNEMLDRIDRSAERQRRFVADASHELRTPLTRLRTELETGGDGDVLAEVVALQRLVDDLLAIARADGEPVRRARVDLDDVVLQEAAALRAGREAVTVDTSGVSAAQVGGDASQLRRLVANLLDNAARHATSTITITLAEREDVAVLRVVDDGVGVPAEQAARIFERFARVDEARRGEDGGVGLGLAIARAIAEAHGGHLDIELDAGPGGRFVVQLPTA